MKTVTETHAHIRHEDIAELAKQIWKGEGRQAGRDLEYWLRAERQLRSNKDPGNNLPSKQLSIEAVQSRDTGKAIKLPESVAKLVQAK